MSNINLYQDTKTEETKKQIPRLVDSGFFISIGLLVVVFGIFVGLKLYDESLQSKVEGLNVMVSEANKNLGASNVNKLVDFEARSKKASEEIDEREMSLDIMKAIEDSMVEGVSANSINIDKNTESVDMDLQSGSFEAVAKQILSFKKNDYFNSIEINSAVRGEELISFTIRMNLK